MGENSNPGSQSNFYSQQSRSLYLRLTCGTQLRSGLSRGKCVSLSVGMGRGQQRYWDRAFRTSGSKHTVPYIFRCITCPRYTQVFLAKELGCTHNHYAPVLYHCITNRYKTWYPRTIGVDVSFKSEILAGGVVLTHRCCVVPGVAS